MNIFQWWFKKNLLIIKSNEYISVVAKKYIDHLK